MDTENKDKITAAQDEEESILLPEGYEGEDLFADPGEKADEEAKEPAENAQKQDAAGEKAQEGAAQERQSVPQTRLRDFRSEITALLTQHPQLREKLVRGEKLPQEVISDCVKNGVPLRTAFAEYEAKQARAEAEQMRRENEILKQNSAAAAKAPVKGTAAGGAADTKGKDPFLEGLLSDE